MSAALDTVFAALADPTRRAILSMLLEDDMAVTDVAAGFAISLAAISKHLGVLARAGLIAQERRGRVVWCKLEPDALRDASVWMQGFGQFEGADLDALESLIGDLDRSSEPEDELLEELVAAEIAVWQALVEGDAEADGAALHPAFLGVYPDGFADRAAHVAQLAEGPTVTEFALEQRRALPLATGHALLSYRATFRRPGGDGPEVMWVSSIWQRRGPGWINVFSQDTPAQT